MARPRRANIEAICSSDGAVLFQFHSRDRRDRLARQVIERWSQAARHDDQIGTLAGCPHNGDVVGQVIGHGGVEADRDADLGEPAARPLAVGIEVLAAGDLAADRDDLGFHDEKSLTGMGTVGMAAGTMKTSYYLVAAAGLTAAAAVAYDHLPARAESPTATLPLSHDSAALVPMPAVPDLPLPAIVPPPDGPLVIPVSGTPAPLPALPTTPTIPPSPSFPANPVETSPPPVAPAYPVVPPAPTSPPTTPIVPPVGTPVVAPATPIVSEIPPSVSPPSVTPRRHQCCQVLRPHPGRCRFFPLPRP